MYHVSEIQRFPPAFVPQLRDYGSAGDFAEFALSERSESNGLGMTRLDSSKPRRQHGLFDATMIVIRFRGAHS